ncbi:hypothetical protein RVR_5565 [Actinacidiphila reveromycinica]|uniref:Cytidyltransferase-like domain-containing protein n=1 Tax=Actinacidiphila reveromycinica TaxID=659352 RepID=A0A7U3URM3_9ACTN|nr:adenylyltransferase/cytidyltransferase family protein [Streptomyces sp. SN-593]BBA99090.1 hypothetical protein RVR_5565 [Streptomyces sp. SN-593]
MPQYDVASAHGRFQPLHLGHVEYLLAAKERCRFLHVGVTQFVRSRLAGGSVSAPHRALPESNPWTFYERRSMIREALVHEGVPAAEFDVIPFPVEDLAVLPEFLPTAVPVLTTIYEEWNREKVAMLRSVGYTVEVLWDDRPRVYSGTEVRRLVATGDARFEKMVPDATVRSIRSGGVHRWTTDAVTGRLPGAVEGRPPGSVGGPPDSAAGRTPGSSGEGDPA